MTNVKSNLYENIPDQLPAELFEELASGRSFRLERIVSNGHVSPPGFWYDQPQNEWIVLLQGAARIEFDDARNDVELKPGDYLVIPGGCRHRVGWTATDTNTVWLAVHFES